MCRMGAQDDQCTPAPDSRTIVLAPRPGVAITERSSANGHAHRCRDPTLAYAPTGASDDQVNIKFQKKEKKTHATSKGAP
jgi:hypothetical protein